MLMKVYFTLAVLACSASAMSIDRTLLPHQVGVEILDSIVHKFRNLPEFIENRFFDHIAWYQTRDGTENVARYDREGLTWPSVDIICHVTEKLFRNVLDNEDNLEAILEIDSIFEIDIKTLSYNDMSIPFYSLLVIYTATHKQLDFCSNIDSHSVIWNNLLLTGASGTPANVAVVNSTEFRSEVTIHDQTFLPEVCSANRDIFIVIPASRCLNEDIVAFLEKFINSFTLGVENTRVSIVVANKVNSLSIIDSFNKKDLLEFVRKLPTEFKYLESGANCSSASFCHIEPVSVPDIMKNVSTQVIDVFRYDNSFVTHALVVVNLARSYDVTNLDQIITDIPLTTVLAVGLENSQLCGCDILLKETLLEITHQQYKNVFKSTSDVCAVQDVWPQVYERICNMHTNLHFDEPVDIYSLESPQKLYFFVDLRVGGANDDVYIVFGSYNEEIVGFLSFTYEYPNSALFDNEVDPGTTFHIDPEHKQFYTGAYLTVVGSFSSGTPFTIVTRDEQPSGPNVVFLLEIIFACGFVVVVVLFSAFIIFRLKQSDYQNRRQYYYAPAPWTDLTEIQPDPEIPGSIIDIARELAIPKKTVETDGELIEACQFSLVRRGILRISATFLTEEVALKQLRPPSHEELGDFLREVYEFKVDLRHRNIGEIFGITTMYDLPQVVVSYLKNGTVAKYLRKCYHENTIRDLELYEFGIQICFGMGFVSSRGYVNRELTCANILLSENMQIKLSDFGICEERKDSVYYRLQQSGKPLPIRWYPPEMLTNDVFVKKSDVWSFGVVMWEMFSACLTEPYEGYSNFELPTRIKQGLRLERPKRCPEILYYKIMKNCWDSQRSGRPDYFDMADILQKFADDEFDATRL